MGVKLSNNATSTLAASITDVATSLSVQSGDAALFPSLSTDEWFPITVIDSSGNIEVMRVTARTGAVLTVTRGQEGTTAQAFNAGSRVDLRLTAGGALAIPEAAITDATAKTVPVDADYVGVTDSAANSQLKKLSWANLKKEAMVQAIAGGAEETAPAASDLLAILDVSAGNALKKVTWATLKKRFENRIINPAGVYIQRGGTTIAAGTSKYVFDRFYVTNSTNQTVTVSQNLLSLGASFGPGGERFTMRYSFSSAPTTGTLRIEQRLENVTSIKEGNWTLTAWMSGPSGSETLAAEAVQHFGTGGAPSSNVTTAMTFAGNSPTTIYDASTNRRCWGVSVPSMSSKVLGTDYNDYLSAAMVLTPRQSGNYDITWVSFVEGDASNEYDPNGNYRSDLDFTFCQRFFRKSYEPEVAPGTATDPSVLEVIASQSGSGTGTRSSAKLEIHLSPLMRSAPTVVPYSYNTGASNKIYNASTATDIDAETGATKSKFFIRPTGAVTDGNRYFYHYTANAEFN